MNKRFFTLLLLLVVGINHGQAQNAQSAETKGNDTVAYETTFYFPTNITMWLQGNNKVKADELVRWLKENKTARIELRGWADGYGRREYNKQISIDRATSIRQHLVKNGIAAKNIKAIGKGEDKFSKNPIARRVDVQAFLPKMEPKLQPVPDRSEELKRSTEEMNKLIAAQRESEEAKRLAEQARLKAEQEAARLAAALEAERNKQPEPKQPEPKQPEPKEIKEVHEPKELKYYAGVELGVPFGRASFTAFSADKTYGGFQLGLFAGYRFSRTISGEFGFLVGKMRMGSTKCCADYYLGDDGKTYTVIHAEANRQPYRDLYSKVSLQQYAFRLNVDVLQILCPNPDSRLRAFVTPAIYAIRTKAEVREIASDALFIEGKGKFRIGAGLGIGATYRVISNLDLGLRTGMVWMSGKELDGIDAYKHKGKSIWNNTMTISWNF